MSEFPVRSVKYVFFLYVFVQVSWINAQPVSTRSDIEIKELANECEKIFNNLHYAVQKEKINEEKTGRRSSMTDRLFMILLRVIYLLLKMTEILSGLILHLTATV